MTKIPRTPQEKKRLEYERDHYVNAEYPHAFRRNWPRKKAKLSRKFRRRAEANVQNLRAGAADVIDYADEQGLTAGRVDHSGPRDRLRKNGVRTLHERVRVNLRQRVHRAGRNRFFNKPYSSELHSEAFKHFLQDHMACAGAESRAILSHVAALMVEPAEGAPRRSRERVWLAAFLSEEPAWEPRVLAWLATTVEEA